MYNYVRLPVESTVKFLGVTFTNNLSWYKYVNCSIDRAFKATNILRSLTKTYWGADHKILLILYQALVRSHFDYGFLCYAANVKLVNILDVIQNKNLRVITGCYENHSYNFLQVECNTPPLSLRFKYF